MIWIEGVAGLTCHSGVAPAPLRCPPRQHPRQCPSRQHSSGSHVITRPSVPPLGEPDAALIIGMNDRLGQPHPGKRPALVGNR